MIFELIIRYIEENWTWIIAGFAIVVVAITILMRKRKASKSCTGIKGEEEQSKTIPKGRKLAVFFNGRFTISGYAASIIGTRKDQQDSYLEQIANLLIQGKDLPKNVIKNYNQYYREIKINQTGFVKKLVSKLCKFMNV